MLTVTNVTKKYKNFLANDNLSFRIEDGEVGILLGPNGAGKSTIIKSTIGLLRYSGTIEIDGLDNRSLEAKRKKMGKELSKGMQQKVSICCALVHSPSFVIFDEPMVGLDPHAIKELKQVFRELKDEGKTVLISTHMIDTIEDYWDVAHIMVKGKIAATKHNRGDSDDKPLDELFFEITEGTKEEA